MKSDQACRWNCGDVFAQNISDKLQNAVSPSIRQIMKISTEAVALFHMDLSVELDQDRRRRREYFQVDQHGCEA